MNTLIIILLTLPFISAVVAYIAGYYNPKSSFWIAELTGIALFTITLILFINYTNPYSIEIEWFKFGNISMPMGVYIDSLSLVMLLIATGLGALDIHFAHDYMGDDPHKPRYYAEVLFFIGGMILLVSAAEMTGLFMGWEFMGLASYLLISFWHHQKAPADAGVSAFLFTRFGDIFLFGAIGILFWASSTLNLQELNTMAVDGKIDKDILFVSALFIFIAAMGKSGQFPLFPWLMRAMEGPTTVSALIHGATMVNSGIYIVARLFNLYTEAEALMVVATIGAISAFLGATSAIVQSEMKKVLAYSTMSHLSIAFVGLGAGSLAAGMTHLVNHAVFKALLFLGAGAVMLSAHHVKDMWKLGGLGKKLIWVAIFMAMGVLSLSGLPPFSGYYSKDSVIAAAWLSSDTQGAISILVTVAGLLSIVYIGRLWVLIFAGNPRDEKLFGQIKSPSKFWIVLPLAIMAIATLVMGFFQEDISKFISANHLPHLENLGYYMMTGIVILAILVYIFYYKRLDITQKLSSQPMLGGIKDILFNGWFIEKIIHWGVWHFIIEGIAKASYYFDKNVVDRLINATVPSSSFINRNLDRVKATTASTDSIWTVAGVIVIVLAIALGGIK